MDLENYIEALKCVQNFVQEHKPQLCVVEGGSITISLEEWYGPRKREEIIKNTKEKLEILKKIPNLSEVFNLDYSCNCLYLNLKIEDDYDDRIMIS